MLIECKRKNKYNVLSGTANSASAAAAYPFFKKSAFTLAEVLITLGIIGVVAAMTIPGLIETYQKAAAAQKLKETYSIITQAAKMYANDYDTDIDGFDTQLSGKEFIETYFAPYVKIMQRCTSLTDCYGDKTPLAIDRSTKLDIDYLVTLINGSYLGVSATRPSGIIFYVDLNGSSKPNFAGRDIFYFYLVNTSTYTTSTSVCNNISDLMKNLKSGIYPGGYAACYVPHASYTRSELLGTSIDRSCNRNATKAGLSGDACAAVIMMDGWKISKDYPW